MDKQIDGREEKVLMHTLTHTHIYYMIKAPFWVSNIQNEDRNVRNEDRNIKNGQSSIWLGSSEDLTQLSTLSSLEQLTSLPPEHCSLISLPISLAAPSVSFSGSFSTSPTFLDGRVPRAQSSYFSALSTFTPRVTWANMAMETPVMLKLTSPSPGLFAGQALNCPTTLCAS